MWLPGARLGNPFVAAMFPGVDLGSVDTISWRRALVALGKKVGSESVTGAGGLAPIIRRRGLGLRLIVWILLVSSCVTLVFTALQLYLDFQRDAGAIERRLDDVEVSTAGTLSASLWQIDLNQARLQIDGILRLPGVRAVTVRLETDHFVGTPGVVAVGAHRDDAPIVRRFPVLYRFHDRDITLGTVTIEATLDEVWRRLWDSALLILVTQGIKTFLVSLFTLFIVWKLVTRHLTTIARFVSAFDIRRSRPPPLQLDRRRQGAGRGDELDQVTDAFNDVADGLASIYRELQEVNAELAADNHARRLAEQEVRQLNALLELRVRQRTLELEAANRELGAFAYSVSHDLRAPVRRIDGFTRILEEDCGEQLGDDGRYTLARIRAGVQDMGEMIDSFLRLSRSTRQELALEPVDLSALAEQAVARLREREPGRMVEVIIEPGLRVEADRRLVRVVLENLFDNAWKYTRRAAVAVIEFGRRDGGGGQPEFFVRDNGTGFDMAFASRLFQPFQRLHSPEEYEGSGIGLATVQRIVARHGGRIRSEAAPGVGATFFFTFGVREG